MSSVHAVQLLSLRVGLSPSWFATVAVATAMAVAATAEGKKHVNTTNQTFSAGLITHTRSFGQGMKNKEKIVLPIAIQKHILATGLEAAYQFYHCKHNLKSILNVPCVRKGCHMRAYTGRPAGGKGGRLCLRLVQKAAERTN